MSEKEIPQSSLKYLWDLIPKDTQNMIEKQYNGYRKARAMHEEEHYKSFNAGLDCAEVGGISFDLYYSRTFSEFIPPSDRPPKL